MTKPIATLAVIVALAAPAGAIATPKPPRFSSKPSRGVCEPRAIAILRGSPATCHPYSAERVLERTGRP